MKQKIVIKVEMHCEKCRSEALKTAVSSYGVISVALGKKDKSQLEVIGEQVDSVLLANSLRKNLARKHRFCCLCPENEAYVELISVSEEKEGEKERPKTVPLCYGNMNPPVILQEIIRDDPCYSCAIM